MGIHVLERVCACMGTCCHTFGRMAYTSKNTAMRMPARYPAPRHKYAHQHIYTRVYTHVWSGRALGRSDEVPWTREAMRCLGPDLSVGLK